MTLRIWFLLLSTSVVALSCAKDKDTKDLKEPKGSEAKTSDRSNDGEFEYVREDLYKKLVADIEGNKLTGSFWVFHSSSGWGPAYGQFSVADTGGMKLTVTYDYKGKQGTRKLGQYMLDDFKAKAETWKKLANFSPPIMDSYRYNYFQLQATRGKIKVQAQLYVNAPDLEGRDSPYMDIVRNFQSLVTDEDLEK